MCLVPSKIRAAGLTLSCFTSVLLAGVAVEAAPITFDFTAEVTNVSSGLPQFDTTQTITGSFTYESTTPPRIPGSPDPSEQSTFDALTNLQFSIDGYSASLDSAGGAPEIRLEDFGVPDRFALAAGVSDGLSGPVADGNALLGFILNIDYIDSITDASILPATLPFDAASVLSTLLIIDFANGQQVIGQLTSLQLQQAPPGAEIPEPTSIAIFLVAATVTGGAGFARRKRFRRA
ncbi:MAG: PEP-CTERM sorting domain-containing protein [Planctomycetaceae bacterium]